MQPGTRDNLAGRARSLLQIAATAFSTWGAIIGTCIACLALCNLILRLPNMSIADVFWWLLNAYQQTIHPPIDFVLSWLPFSLPGPAKDILVAYFAIGGVMYRSLSFGSPPRRFSPNSDRWRVLAGTVLMAIGWPYFIRSTLKKPLYVIRGKHGYKGRLPARSKEHAEFFLKSTNTKASVACNDRQLIILYIVALLLSVLFFITINEAINELGMAG